MWGGVRRWKLGPNRLNWFHRVAALHSEQARTMSSQYPVLIWGKLSVTDFTHDSLEAKHGRSAPASLQAPSQSAWRDEAHGQTCPIPVPCHSQHPLPLRLFIILKPQCPCWQLSQTCRVPATHQGRLVHISGMLSLTNEAQRLINSTGFFH